MIICTWIISFRWVLCQTTTASHSGYGWILVLSNITKAGPMLHAAASWQQMGGDAVQAAVVLKASANAGKLAVEACHEWEGGALGCTGMAASANGGR